MLLHIIHENMLKAVHTLLKVCSSFFKGINWLFSYIFSLTAFSNDYVSVSSLTIGSKIGEKNLIRASISLFGSFLTGKKNGCQIFIFLVVWKCFGTHMELLQLVSWLNELLYILNFYILISLYTFISETSPLGWSIRGWDQVFGAF